MKKKKVRNEMKERSGRGAKKESKRVLDNDITGLRVKRSAIDQSITINMLYTHYTRYYYILLDFTIF